jgi:pyrophosphatase PpaX
VSDGTTTSADGGRGAARAWRAVVFDLDGTLLDSVPLIVASHRHALQTVLGRDEPDEVLRAGIGKPLIEQMRVFDPVRADDLFAAYQAWNLEATPRYVRWFDGVPELLERLCAAGLRLGVATSKMRASVDLAFRTVPPPVTFDAIVTLEDTTTHKPDPAPLLHALEALGTAAAHALYVGDAVVDVEAARAAGSAAVAVTWGAGTTGDLHAAAPLAVVDTPAALGDVIVAGAEAAA